jgi:pyruvate formate lyase activating enzyme
MAESHPGNIGIAYTYNEPSVWFEQMLDISKESASRGLKNVVVSNGYFSEGPLKELLNYVDAFNIDIKSFNEKVHKSFTGGNLNFVLKNLLQIIESKKHLEITSLIVPGINDSIVEFSELVKWISENLGKNVPLHISRYFPRYKISSNATPVENMLEMANIASKILNYVYIGNISETDYQTTRCPQCEEIVIVRDGYSLPVKNYGKNGECIFCGNKILIV